MTTWKHRLATALEKREKTYADLARACKVAKPSAYAWAPTKPTTMMDGDNAAIVCELLSISPMWLFHGKGKSGLEAPAPKQEPKEAEVITMPSAPRQHSDLHIRLAVRLMEGLDQEGKVWATATLRQAVKDYRAVAKRGRRKSSN